MIAAIFVFAHVPTYSTCLDDCCTVHEDFDVSRVFYFKNSGGYEIHTRDLQEENQILNFDIVLRDAVNQSTYDVYVGCGGCMAEDPILTSPYDLRGYQTTEIEPFTQTAYRSVFPRASRAFNTSSLAGCKHFTVRLVYHGEGVLIWGAVIGLRESFTFLELLTFPIYILRNHGGTWNELPYTYWLWLFVGAPLVLCVGRSIYTNCLYIPSIRDADANSVREVLYEIAFIGFIAAAAEMLTHLIYVQVGNPVGWGFWVGLLVIILPAALGETFLYITWYAMRKPATCGGCSTSPACAIVEILTGFVFLLLFGAGIYVGPAAIMLAGVIRFYEAYVGKGLAPAEPIARKPIPPPLARSVSFTDRRDRKGRTQI
jgi:hypothetical protein